MRTARLAIAGGILALLAGCGAASAPSFGTGDPDAVPSIPAVAPGDLRYACGRFPFAAGILEVRGTDEQAANPAAVALRAHLAQVGPDIDILPDHGWTLAGMDATGAEFVTAGGDLGMKMVSVDAGPDGWKVGGWGDCSPRRVMPQGLGDASWMLAAGETIGPATRAFQALVTERACASGQSSEGRVVGPDVLAVGDRVLVTFAVRELSGGQTQTCPGNPPTGVRVDLGEALGSRRLLDGGSLPPRDPTTEP